MIDKEKLTPQMLDKIAHRFKVVSDPRRLRILHELQRGELSVGDLAAAAATSQPNVSKHLRALQEAGLVSRRQAANSVFYSIADASVFEMCEVVCGSLKRQAEETMASLAGI